MNQPTDPAFSGETTQARIQLKIDIELRIDSADTPRVLSARLADALRLANGIPSDVVLPNCLSVNQDYCEESTIKLQKLLASQSSKALDELPIAGYAINDISFSPSAENGVTITDEHGNVILQGLP